MIWQALVWQALILAVLGLVVGLSAVPATRTIGGQRAAHAVAYLLVVLAAASAIAAAWAGALS